MNATNGINKSEYININVSFFRFAFNSQNYDKNNDCSLLFKKLENYFRTPKSNSLLEVQKVYSFMETRYNFILLILIFIYSAF